MEWFADRPTERDSESDRQMIVLALAHLAVERPGWLHTCRDMAEERFAAGPMFETFLNLYMSARAFAPVEPH
jgi:hypothetical protein